MSKHPSWLDNAIFYEIYPQSFKDTNSDGIGDFAGILEKLDYIASIGCNAIWMNPCFDSPFMDAGYDISDYYKAAPRYGSNEDLKQLMKAIHQKGMHILLDLVPGHTSIAHPWFKESMKPEKNAYTDRYIWTDSAWELAEGYGTLRGISQRDGSCVVNFFSHQPALNYGYYQPDKSWQQGTEDIGPRETLDTIMDVMRFWLRMGCDGFRVDMAGAMVKNDKEQKGTIALWKKVRAFLDKEFPDAAMISEWGEPQRAIQGGFHMDFLLHFGPTHYNDLLRCDEPWFSSRGLGDASEFVKAYVENYEHSERKGLICVPSGNHDMIRLAHYLHGNELKIAFAFILSMPGAPFIYMGDEIGMRYVEGLTSVEGGYERTGSRSPFQWDDSVNAGFSSAAKDLLYTPMDESEDRPTVASQDSDPNSLLNEIRRQIHIRQEHSALQSLGEIDFCPVAKNAYPLMYIRSDENERILVILNPSANSQQVKLPGEIENDIYFFGGKITKSGTDANVPPCSAGWYKLK